MGTVTDIDGNIYDTVIIGTQEWTVQNFKCTKLNNGTPIPEVTDPIEWIGLRTPGRCWYNNDYATYGTVYGLIYNGYAAVTEKLAPTGWRVPLYYDFEQLLIYLGGVSIDGYWNVVGGKIKEVGTSHWSSPNTGATNEVGFTALPSGGRNRLGNFVSINTSTQFWTKSAIDPSVPDELNVLALRRDWDKTLFYQYYTQWLYSGNPIRLIRGDLPINPMYAVDSPFSNIGMPFLNQQMTPGGSGSGKNIHNMGNTRGNVVDNSAGDNLINDTGDPKLISSGGGYKAAPSGSFVLPGRSSRIKF